MPSTAVSSQGTGVTFAGSSLGKVVSVSANFVSPHKEIRVLGNNLDTGTGQYLSVYEPTTCEQTVEVEAIASGLVLSSIVGTKGQLSINGLSWFVELPSCICESFKIAAKVGDLVRVSFAFKRSYY